MAIQFTKTHEGKSFPQSFLRPVVSDSAVKIYNHCSFFILQLRLGMAINCNQCPFRTSVEKKKRSPERTDSGKRNDVESPGTVSRIRLEFELCPKISHSNPLSNKPHTNPHLQHLIFPNGHPSSYSLGSTLPNFGGQISLMDKCWVRYKRRWLLNEIVVQVGCKRRI